MDTDIVFYLVAIPALIFAGVSKGGFGSGAAFASTPMIAMVLPPEQAIGLMLPLLMMMDLASLRAYWRKWSWPHARKLMISSVPGIVLGYLLFSASNPDLLRFGIGVIAVGFVSYELARKSGVLRIGTRDGSGRSGWFWGTVAGFTSYISHAGGPPAAIYLLSQNLGKLKYQATTVLVFWWINSIKLGFYFENGFIRTGDIFVIATLAPFGIIGVLLGFWAHRKMSEVLFFTVTYILLLITGLRLIWQSLT